MSDDIREALSNAFDKAESGGDDGGGTPADDAGAADDGAKPPEGEQVPENRAGESAPAGEGEKPPVPKPEGVVPPEGKEVEKKAEEVPPQPTIKAPAGWKPEVREHWAKLPPEVQAEVTRREIEVTNVMRQTTEARRTAEELQTILQPYLPMIAAEGGTPMRAIAATMQTAAALRTAAPQQKAQLVAQMIQQFGVDVELLDSVLSNTPLPQGRADPAVHDYFQREVAPLKEFVSTLQTQMQQSQEQIRQSVQTELEAFASDPKNEFFEDVLQDIGDILQLAAQRGQKMSLQQAYDRAIMLHPSIVQVVEQRKSADRVAQQNAAAQKARGAAASVSGSPASGAAPSSAGDDQKDPSIRSALSAAFKRAEGRV